MSTTTFAHSLNPLADHHRGVVLNSLRIAAQRGTPASVWHAIARHAIADLYNARTAHHAAPTSADALRMYRAAVARMLRA